MPWTCGGQAGKVEHSESVRGERGRDDVAIRLRAQKCCEREHRKRFEDNCSHTGLARMGKGGEGPTLRKN